MFKKTFFYALKIVRFCYALEIKSAKLLSISEFVLKLYLSWGGGGERYSLGKLNIFSFKFRELFYLH